ncbi:MAG: flagellar basal body L-ring protein FlgH [Geothrix sp.]|nr:flagellar basal body L-ring protein FlgH [Geothrix sp.]
MRKMLPIVLLLVGLGCSLPKRHDENLVKKPAIPLVEEAPNAPPLNEGSLWRDRPIIADLRAYRINDLVTINISEATTAIAKANVATSRAGSNSLSGSFGIGGGSSLNPTTGTTQKYAGAGNTDRSATFTTTVTARVVKVVGNGNLIFEGFRDIQLNNENQRLYVAGMLDPHMLDATNTIKSGQVAELRIGYGGQGVIDETLKPGYISRLLAYIWPF